MSTETAETSPVSDERLMELLELYRYGRRIPYFRMVLREVERRGLEIPEWVYESP